MGKSEKLSESYIEKDRPFCTNTNCIYIERKTKIEWIGNIYIYTLTETLLLLLGPLEALNPLLHNPLLHKRHRLF